ncbi:unnamed protein product [Calicophoron daubneyi]|uniref:G-protein coupled receptors family 1 profile domain-containing protein n=1 Tax=Calicophoron daubneyi TaxID=300641 RepID=A0AAV2TI79_CALDB
MIDDQATSWTPVVLTSFLLLLTWLANCILLGGALQTATSGRIVPVAYFFVGSQAVAALLHVTLNLPPSVIGILFGSANIQSHVHIFCLYSTYLDTLFCNLTFLQTFFSSLDAYLRLRNPVFYLSSARRRPALWLKVGSPWLVAALQAIGQLALSDRQKIRLHICTRSKQDTGGFLQAPSLQTTCLLPDPNFLTIRTAIAYALPLLTCIVLVGLQLRCLRRLRLYSSESLYALLQVRSPHAQIQRSYVIPSRHIPSIAAQKFRAPVDCPVVQPRVLAVRPSASENISLQLLSSTTENQTEDYDKVTPLMIGSWHGGRQVTIETLLPDCPQSAADIQGQQGSQVVPAISLPHVLISSATLPIIEIEPVETAISGTESASVRVNVTSATYECPQHGTIRVTTDGKIGGDISSSAFVQTAGDMTTSVVTSIDEPPSTRTVSNKRTDLGEKEGPLLLAAEALRPELCGKSAGGPKCRTIKRSISDDGVRRKLYSRTQPNNKQKVSNSYKEKVGNTLRTATPLWLTAYRGEQLAVAINLVSCIIAVGTWSPYILATLAHGLCLPLKTETPREMTVLSSFYPQIRNQPPAFTSRCMIQLTPDRIADFRWWAYASSGLLLPFLLFFLDLGLREGCWKALKYSNQNDDLPRGSSDARPSNKYSIEPTSPLISTYRCAHIGNSFNILAANGQVGQEMHELERLWDRRQQFGKEAGRIPISSNPVTGHGVQADSSLSNSNSQVFCDSHLVGKSEKTEASGDQPMGDLNELTNNSISYVLVPFATNVDQSEHYLTMLAMYALKMPHRRKRR